MTLWLVHHTVVVLVVLWCVHLAAAQEFRLCTFTDPTTSKKYDLTNPAKLYTSKAAVTDPDLNGWLYYASPCQPVRGNAQCLVITTPAVCQLESKSVWPLGSITQGTVGPLANGGEGFVVSFQALYSRGSNVSYICDRTAGEGKFKWTRIPKYGEPEPYIWEFEWRTSYACPTGSGGGGSRGSSDSGGLAGGWIFIICLVTVRFVYFAGGVVVQKFYFKREGLEIIPNSVFCVAAIQDGNVFAFSSARRLCGRGYQPI